MAVAAFMAWIAAGLRIDDETATLWGLRLVRPREIGAAACRDAGFAEMVHHAWTFATLPWLCFGGLDGVLRTVQPQFRQFLRFGRRSRGFAVAARCLAAVGIAGLAALPLVLGACTGLFRGVAIETVRDAALDVAASTTTVVLVVVLLAAAGVSRGLAAGIGFAAPWFLTAAAEFLARNDWQRIAERLPAGLPYALSVAGPVRLQATLVLVAVVLVVVTAASLRTRRVG